MTTISKRLKAAHNELNTLGLITGVDLQTLIRDCIRVDTFYIVFMNDSPEFVSTDEEAAKQEMAKLKEEYFEKNKWSFNNDREEYKIMCYWHIHNVKGTL